MRGGYAPASRCDHCVGRLGEEDTAARASDPSPSRARAQRNCARRSRCGARGNAQRCPRSRRSVAARRTEAGRLSSCAPRCANGPTPARAATRAGRLPARGSAGRRAGTPRVGPTCDASPVTTRAASASGWPAGSSAYSSGSRSSGSSTCAQRLAERRVAEFAQPRVMPDRRGRQHGLREHDALAAGAELDLAQQAGVVVDLEPFAQRSGERGFTQPAKPPESHRRTAQRTDARGEHSRLGEPGQQVVRHARRNGGERSTSAKGLAKSLPRVRTGRRSAP